MHRRTPTSAKHTGRPAALGNGTDTDRVANAKKYRPEHWMCPHAI